MTDADDPLRYFRDEVRELGAALARDLLRLEATPMSDLVQRLLRHAHTLKGAARVVGQNDIAERVHALEAALLPLRERPAASQATFAGLLGQIDEITAYVDALSPKATAPRQSSGDEMVDLMSADDGALDALSETIAEAMRQLRLARNATATVAAPALDRAERDLAQALDAATTLRLVPAAAIMGALERTARDVAQALGKDAGLAATGDRIRLEPTVLSALRPALIQLIRNAVAHGIEPPAERARRGKPRQGRVALDIERRGARIVFICADDGAGIDLEAVRRVARAQGATTEESAGLGADGLLRLLLQGGITTATEPNQLAGRGIGFDVVRDAAVRLGGAVEIDTTPGAGTRIALSIPVSLATIEALLVQTEGGATAAVPLTALRRTARLEADDADTLLHDGVAVPLRHLDTLLGGPPSGAAAPFAAVIANGNEIVALAVERLLEIKAIAVRPLPDTTAADGVIMGAALDGEGVPIPVLDAERLIAAARVAVPAARAPTPPAKPPVLVIDDSLTTRMLEQSILESAGFEVDLAVSAEDGLAKAALRRYCLFLVDVEMPGMGGFAFVARTRADSACRGTPALLVSSRNGADDLRRAAEAGASGYIVKGEFDQSHFLDTVRRLAV